VCKWNRWTQKVYPGVRSCARWHGGTLRVSLVFISSLSKSKLSTKRTGCGENNRSWRRRRSGIITDGGRPQARGLNHPASVYREYRSQYVDIFTSSIVISILSSVHCEMGH